MGFASPLRSGFAFIAAHWRCACKLPCIPTADEFPMNSERPYIVFCPFFETSCELVDNVREFDSKYSKRTSMRRPCLSRAGVAAFCRG
jgi:hypothetical protein